MFETSRNREARGEATNRSKANGRRSLYWLSEKEKWCLALRLISLPSSQQNPRPTRESVAGSKRVRGLILASVVLSSIGLWLAQLLERFYWRSQVSHCELQSSQSPVADSPLVSETGGSSLSREVTEGHTLNTSTRFSTALRQCTLGEMDRHSWLD